MGEKFNIYCFWTGTNPLTKNREECLKSIIDIQTAANVILVTPENLERFVSEPLHKAFKHLSLTHKSDYLRCYFMYHYGGGYSDIKKHTVSWKNVYVALQNNSSAQCVGYEEIEGGAANTVPAYLWKELIGNCAYIFKPKTQIALEWLTQLHSKLDVLYEDLRLNPPLHARDRLEYGGKYPIPWTGILGDIFHPLVYKYRKYVLNYLPPPLFNNYM